MKKSQRPTLHVCTIASKVLKGLTCLQESCVNNGIPLQVLGMGQPFHGYGDKLLSVQQFVQKLPDEDLVVFVDAFDVLFLAPLEEIIDTFLKFNAPFVISAERTCWPYRELAPKYPKSPTAFQYINAGGYMGYVGYIKKLMQNLNPKGTDDDQGLLTYYYLQHLDEFKLDTSCELFLPLLNFTDEIDLDIPHKKVKLLETKTHPAIIHGNGSSLWFGYIYERFFGQKHRTLEHRKQKLAENKNKTIFLELFVGYRSAPLPRLLQLIQEYEYDKSDMTIFFSDLRGTNQSSAVIEKWALDHEKDYKQILFDSKEIQKIPYSEIRQEAYMNTRLPPIAQKFYDYQFFINFDLPNSDFQVNELASILKHIKTS